ncbi:MAG: MFS transporter [Pseudomonadota bacterium]
MTRLVSSKMLLWLSAKQISDISAFLTSIILNVYALALFGNPAFLGILLALRMSGSIIGAYLVPVLSRRLSLSTILVLAEFGSALTMLVLVVSSTEAHRVLLLLVAPCIGIFHGIFHVALYSQVHSFVERENQHRMNSVLASMDGIAVVVGGIASSILYQLMPLRMIFLLDAMTFVVAALVFVFFRRTLPAVQDGGAARPAPGKTGRFPFSGQVVRAILATAGFLFAARFMEAFGSSAHNVGFPIISAHFDPANPAFLVGWIMALWGAGKVVATLATTPMIRRMQGVGLQSDMIFVVFLVLTFGFFLGVFRSEGFWMCLAFAFMAGLFDASTETVYYSALQSNTKVRTDTLIGASYSLERVGMGAGILLAGYAYSVIEAPRDVATGAYIGAILICCALALAKSVRVVRRAARSSYTEPKA